MPYPLIAAALGGAGQIARSQYLANEAAHDAFLAQMAARSLKDGTSYSAWAEGGFYGSSEMSAPSWLEQYRNSIRLRMYWATLAHKEQVVWPLMRRVAAVKQRLKALQERMDATEADRRRRGIIV